jgi:hypothetical protein
MPIEVSHGAVGSRACLEVPLGFPSSYQPLHKVSTIDPCGGNEPPREPRVSVCVELAVLRCPGSPAPVQVRGGGFRAPHFSCHTLSK